MKIQYKFHLLMMSIQCSKHVDEYNKLIIKQILCIKLVNYKGFSEMHGQQYIKIP